VEHYATLGALTVEMEFTALATVAAFREIELAAMLMVSDELWAPNWRPGFHQPHFKQKSRAVLDALFEWLRKFKG
jgi:purine-nucleoside phosphorylase